MSKIEINKDTFPKVSLEGLDSYQIAKMVDHSLLHPSMTDAEFEAECEVARKYNVGAVCVKPYQVKRAAELMAGTQVDVTVNQPREAVYYPVSKLSVVVPLNGSSVQLMMIAPSGEAKEVYHGVLNAGTYRIALSSGESGDHTVQITMDDVEMETQTVVFE